MFARPAGTGFFLASQHLRRETASLVLYTNHPMKTFTAKQSNEVFRGRVCSVPIKWNCIFSWKTLDRMSIWDGINELDITSFDVIGSMCVSKAQDQLEYHISRLQITPMTSERSYQLRLCCLRYLNSLDWIDSVPNFCETYIFFFKCHQKNQDYFDWGTRFPFLFCCLPSKSAKVFFVFTTFLFWSYCAPSQLILVLFKVFMGFS